jgi:antitoxin HicB
MMPEDYVSLPYHIELVRDTDEDGRSGWVASVAELPGCLSQGDDPGEAVASVQDAMLGWISIALEDGSEIPPPRGEAQHSGKFVVRVPRSLHAALVAAADREGVSLNQFVSSALAGAVRWPEPSSLGPLGSTVKSLGERRQGVR